MNVSGTRCCTRAAGEMGIFSRFKKAFALAPQAQFLGDDGVLLVLRPRDLDRIESAHGEQIMETCPVAGVVATYEAAARLIVIEAQPESAGAALRWTVTVGPKPAQQSEAAQFVNIVNRAAGNSRLGVETFVHPRS